MKVNAHLATVSIAARSWRATMIALGTVLGASVLILTLQSGGLLTYTLLDHWRASLTAGYQVNPQVTSHRVSLDVHLTSEGSEFSVAHAPPANVTLSQRFSIGAEARAGFEAFGETAIRKILDNDKAKRQLRPRRNRMMLMLMLLRLRDNRRG